MEILNYLMKHSVEIVAIIGGGITVATMIARLTPTQEDDKFIEKFRKFFEQISNVFLPNIGVKTAKVSKSKKR